MSYERMRTISLKPTTAAMVANTFVKVTTAGEIVTAGNTEDAIGIVLADSALNDQTYVPVALLDGAKVEVLAGAGVTAGARVMSNATGKAITAVGATARVLGFALETAANADERITIIARPAAGEFVA